MITEAQLMAEKLKASSTNTDEYILRKLITEHDISDMEQGVEYYNNKPKILDRKIYYYNEAGQKVVDSAATNNRVPHNWHKLLVDQKVSYLLGRPPVFNAEPEAYAAAINDYLDEDFDDLLQEIGKHASNKGREYLHPFINPDGEFDYVIFPAEQIIPIYDTDYQRDIIEFIRHYPMWVNDKIRTRAEWWNANTVTYYIENDNGVFELEQTETPNPDSHYYYNEVGFGWGRAPIIEFKNNAERAPDLAYYKDIVDIYDTIVSDYANDIEDIQKLVYALKGYQGENLAEFMTNLKRYKAIKVDGDGGVDTLQAEIAVDAIERFLDREEENIFLFGQGMNVKTDRFGNSPSGIALKFLFHLLDLKASIMARKFAKSMKHFVWFLTEYLSISGKLSVTQDALDTVSVIFSKSMLVNDGEVVEMAQHSKGIVSDETIISNHPWVDDVGEEQQRIEKEQAGMIDLDDVEVDDEPEP